jgi:DNA polymerase-4
MELYSKYSKLVSEIITGKAPLCEKASIDEHYIDITGMDKFFGNYQWSKELRKSIIDNTGLPISFGLSVNKTVSKIATGEGKPNGELQILPENVKSFLFPLSIKKIPMIGNKTYQLLRSMGVLNIKTLSMIPPEMMERVMGKNGIVVWKKANGIDNSPVRSYSERKSISSEKTFDKDTIDIIKLKQKLITMVEKVAYQLRKQQKLTSCITVKIRYSNYDTHTLQKHIPYTAFDHILLKIVLELFDKLYQRRMLIRLIGVRLSSLVNGSQQLNMFEDTPEMTSLYMAMDNMRKRFGEQSVKRAVGIHNQSSGNLTVQQ